MKSVFVAAILLVVSTGCGSKSPTAAPLSYAEALQIRDQEEADAQRKATEVESIQQKLRETLATGETAKRKLAEHMKYDAFDEDKEAERTKIATAKTDVESLTKAQDAALDELKAQVARFERAKAAVDEIRAKAEK